MKIGEVAKRLRLPVSTVRYWSTDEEYKKFLSEKAQGGSGSTRIYSEEDAQVIATIKQKRDQGLIKDQIIEALEAGKMIEEPLPDPPSEEESAARKNLTLIPISQLERALDHIKQKEQELDRITQERDSALHRLDKQTQANIDQIQKLNEKIASLNLQIGRARGLMIGALAGTALLILLLVGSLILLLQYLPAP